MARMIQTDCSLLTTINGSATQLSKEKEALHKSINIIKCLQLKNIVVFDQALYAKAAEITWKH